jgi:hypothetical protein
MRRAGASAVHAFQKKSKSGIATPKADILSETCMHASDSRSRDFAGNCLSWRRLRGFRSRRVDQVVANSVPDTQPQLFEPPHSGQRRWPQLVSAIHFSSNPTECVCRATATSLYSRRRMALERPARSILLALALCAAAPAGAATITVDCTTGAAIGPALGNLKPGDVLLVQGTCRENVLIHSEINGVTVDGQGKATITALDAGQPAVQVLGREITIKGFTVTGGFFGIAVNRGGTALIDNNTIEGAAHSGVEVSQNSFGRIVNNTIRRNRQNGVLVLGSASVHIGVVRSDDQLPKPNIIEDNDGDGIHVIRSSTARIIGNMLRGNRGSGLAVRQTSHADVAGNVFDANGAHGIHVIGNSGINLADSAMRLFERPNTTTTPNGSFGMRCELAAYLDGTIGSLRGKSGVKDVSDTSCIDRSTR